MGELTGNAAWKGENRKRRGEGGGRGLKGEEGKMRRKGRGGGGGRRGVGKEEEGKEEEE